MWNAGQITAENLYWEMGMPEWGSVGNLVSLIQQARPLPAPKMPQPRTMHAAGPTSIQTEFKAIPVSHVHRWILNLTFGLACIAFFLPNLTLEIPILGKIDLSMLDLLTPSDSSSTDSSLRENMPNPEAKPNALDMIKDNKGNVGGIVCGIASLGLLLFYVLTLVWGSLAFGMKRTFPALDIAWLGLAIQYPILMLVGSHLLITGMREQLGSDMRGNPFAGMGQAFVNNVSIKPGLVTWFLLALALAGIVLPRVVVSKRV